MATSKIQFDNKEDLYTDSSILRKNKVVADDVNEIKQVVNNNADELNNKPNIQSSESQSETDAYSCSYLNDKIKDVYSTSETLTNKIWVDNKPIYRKVYSVSNLSTSANEWNNLIDVSNDNIDKLVDCSLLSSQGDGGIWKPNINIRSGYISCYSFVDLGSIDTIIIEYTKSSNQNRNIETNNNEEEITPIDETIGGKDKK